MASEIPFEMTMYNKSFASQGWVGDPLRVEASIRHNQLSTLDFDMRSNSTKIAKLMEVGTRMVVKFEGQQIISGPVRSRGGSSEDGGKMSFRVEDDFRLLFRVLGWPVPAGTISTSTPGTLASEYNTRSGPAENVAKGFIRDNAVTRLGLPVTVEADGSRGSSITVAMRFHPLYDRLFPAFDNAGVGLRVAQSGSGLLVSVYVPTIHSQVLSAASGAVLDWDWVNKSPEATRVIVGGQGEGTARQFIRQTNATRESDWGDVIEVFRDARDSGSGSVYIERANETFQETAEMSGLKLTLAETPAFQFNQSFHIGDQIPFQIGPGLVVTDTLREVKMLWTSENGFGVTPVVGEITDNPDIAFARALRRNAADIRNLRSR
jgi:hypothetical protein